MSVVRPSYWRGEPSERLTPTPCWGQCMFELAVTTSPPRYKDLAPLYVCECAHALGHTPHVIGGRLTERSIYTYTNTCRVKHAQQQPTPCLESSDVRPRAASAFVRKHARNTSIIAQCKNMTMRAESTRGLCAVGSGWIDPRCLCGNERRWPYPTMPATA